MGQKGVGRGVGGGAPKGSKNALKYTDDQLVGIFEDALELLKSGECQYLAQAAQNLGLYTDFFKNFNRERTEVVGELYQEIQNALEVNLLESGSALNKSGKTPVWDMFLLKAKHGYKETSATEIGGIDGKALVVNVIPDGDEID